MNKMQKGQGNPILVSKFETSMTRQTLSWKTNLVHKGRILSSLSQGRHIKFY